MGGVGGAVSFEADFEVANGGEVARGRETEGQKFKVKFRLGPRGLVLISHGLAQINSGLVQQAVAVERVIVGSDKPKFGSGGISVSNGAFFGVKTEF